MARHRCYFNFLACLLVPLVLALFFNQSSFWHYHVLHNGMVVEHSHPFKNDKTPYTPFQNHHHSESDFLVLAQLTQVLTLVVILFSLSLFAIKTPFISFRLSAPVFVKAPQLSSQLLRAPPVY